MIDFSGCGSVVSNIIGKSRGKVCSICEIC